MADDVTLRKCPKCGGEPREAMQDYTYAVSVYCSVCGHGTRWCGNAAEAWAEWDKMPDPALAAKDARIKELEAQLNLVEHQEGNLCETCGQPLEPPWVAEKAHMMDHVAEQQAELAALKARTCATCKEFGVVDGHGHCNRFLSPRDTWSFCECWEPRKDKEVPETCATCKHYDGAEHLSLCWTHDSYVDPADFCSHHEAKEAADG